MANPAATAAGCLRTSTSPAGWNCLGRTTSSGSAVVKISFATKDDKIGRGRWAIVHPQVEVLVLAAMATARTMGRTNCAPIPIAALRPKEIRILAAQARHDALAADDASWDPDYTSPLSEVIEEVRAKSRFRSTNASADELAAKAHARIATARLEKQGSRLL